MRPMDHKPAALGPVPWRRAAGAWLVVALGALAPRVAQAAEPEKPVVAAGDTATATPAASAVTPTVPSAPNVDSATPAVPDPSLASASAARNNDSFSGEASSDATADSFTSQDGGEAEQQHRLDLYGFADFTYTRLLIPKSSVWNRIYFPTNSFSVGNFNLYLSSNLGAGWRALGEVRFLYLPNGSTHPDSTTGDDTRTDTTVLDYAGFEEPIHWGGIRIERVWVEHEFSTLAKLQVGQFLTPYGIWNVDHGSPAVIGIRRPFAVSDELFPEHQVGLQLYGNTFFDPVEVGYHLTLSNGRTPVEYEDFDDNKAVGARLYAKTDAVGSLTVGASFYRGGYYDRSAKYVVLDHDGVTVADKQYTTISKYQELSLGADVKWQWKRLLVQGEAIVNEARFSHGTDSRPRVPAVVGPQGFQPDYRRWGAYGLIGYRTHIVQTMPYFILQYVFAPDDPIVPPVLGAQFGLNIQPTPGVVFKVEYTYTKLGPNPGSIGLGLSPLRILASQVAWAF